MTRADLKDEIKRQSLLEKVCDRLKGNVADISYKYELNDEQVSDAILIIGNIFFSEIPIKQLRENWGRFEYEEKDVSRVYSSRRERESSK